jgi:FkbM family methyltransferase
MLAARLGHQAFRTLGFDIVRLRHLDDFTTRRSLALHHADVVVDVGAHVGVYAQLVREARFRGRIVSFEPFPTAFEQLSKVSASDPLWTCLGVGLSDRTGPATLNVSKNAVSSSFLPVSASEARAAPETAVIDRVETQVTTLDSLRDTLFAPTERLFVKIDVQGAEARVLAGAVRTMGRIVAIESELSILPLYRGQEPMSEMVRLLASYGFRLVALETAYRDIRTGELKQVNGLFRAAS